MEKYILETIKRKSLILKNICGVHTIALKNVSSVFHLVEAQVAEK
jgi:hypothetical protein